MKKLWQMIKGCPLFSTLILSGVIVTAGGYVGAALGFSANKGLPNIFAMAWAHIVLPVPGGPKKFNMLFGLESTSEKPH